MGYSGRKMNLVMGGGGVKGIAYIGAFDAMERRGYVPGKMAGVSAGSLAGSFAASGYSAAGMWGAMGKFDFEKIQVDKLHVKVPVVNRFMEYAVKNDIRGNEGITGFLNVKKNTIKLESEDTYRGNILSNIVTYCKEGCLFDGDLLEEWVSGTLAKKGIRTFADLRGGTVDEINPRGYKIRMTGVDCTRVKVVTLPDDMAFYGIDPDDFEVARAVRISTSVPFAFRPVEIVKKEGSKTKAYSLIDGGVLDSFPSWLINSAYIPTVGFKLNAGENKLFSLDTPLEILKSLITSVHDIGIPKNTSDTLAHIGKIDTTKVYFLDFNLKDDEKHYLYNAGKQTAFKLFSELEHRRRNYRSFIRPYIFSPRFGRKL